jgi:hypothetical protein
MKQNPDQSVQNKGWRPNYFSKPDAMKIVLAYQRAKIVRMGASSTNKTKTGQKLTRKNVNKEAEK